MTKSIKQSYIPNQDLKPMIETFRQMVNECIRFGLENNISTLKRLSSLHYKDLQKYDIQSKYKLTAMSRACGRLPDEAMKGNSDMPIILRVDGSKVTHHP